MQFSAEDTQGTGAAKDLSTQVNYLNDLLEKGAISEQEYDDRAVRLHKIGEVITAITTGNNAELQKILKEHRNLDLNNVSERNATILHLAISSAIKGKAGADVIMTLLGEGLDVDAALNGFTPLLRVCDAGPFAAAAGVVQALVKARANVNFAAKTAEQKTYTPLAAAIVREHSAAVVAALCEGGANVHVALDDGPVIVHAIIYELVEQAKTLLKHHADPNARETSQGASCLASAVSSMNLDLVRALLAAGVDKTASIMTQKNAQAKDLAVQLAKQHPEHKGVQEIVQLLS